jgi:predicted nucleic acid-binding protein
MTKKIPDKKVIQWLNEHNESLFYISILTIGEIQKGIYKLTPNNKKIKLQSWLDNDIHHQFENNILNIDNNIVQVWSSLVANLESKGRTLPAIDSLIIASAIANHCIIITRNTKDMDCDLVEVINPFENT